MNIDAGLTLIVLTMCITVLMTTRISADFVLVAGLAILLTLGVVSPAEGLSGFSNEGTLAVAALYVIAAGLRDTGALRVIVKRGFRSASKVISGQLRMMLPIAVLSAFVNNTPIVASFIPAVVDWAKKNGFSPSKFMMPLSYAAIFGGACTLVGTSTNLIIHGMMLAEPTMKGLGFFELAWVGLPCMAVGFVYVLIGSPYLLKDRIPPLETLLDAREYTVEMIVEPGSELAGQRIEEAGLRHLPGLYLIEIERDGNIMPAVSPSEQLQENDRLVFAGITDSVMDLQRMKGLTPATNQVFKLDAPRISRRFYETAVSASSPMVGKTLAQGQFRSRYGAVVIAVARNGRRINRKLGDIPLQAGDTLLLESDEEFARRLRYSRDFLLLRPIDGAVTLHHERAWVAWLVLAGIVLTAAFGVLSLLNAAMLGAGVMLLTRCVSPDLARRSIDLQVVLVIAAAIGIGAAMQASGAGEFLGHEFIVLAGTEPRAVLAAIYIMTVVLTAVVTNNAAAVLMFPIAIASANELGFDPRPFAVAIAMGASASFATPISYQTNLMVYGPGGYRFRDYVRFGLPLNILIGITTLIVVPMVWPLLP